MNTVPEALNTLISAVNVAHGKGAYSLEEAHYIYLAIDFLNNLQQQGNEGENTDNVNQDSPSHGPDVEEVPQEQSAPQQAPQQAPEQSQGY